jgi:hypothetical protein
MVWRITHGDIVEFVSLACHARVKKIGGNFVGVLGGWFHKGGYLALSQDLML